MRKATLLVSSAMVVLTGLAPAAMALAKEAVSGLPPLMREADEIDAALEGAPAHLRAEAGVYVLRNTGYVRVREPKNGFNCLLVREWAKTFEPTCFDAEGTASVLPVILFRYELLAKGHGHEDIKKLVAEGYRTGEFRAPARVGVAYMLSPRNIVVLDHDSRKAGEAPPHLMFYSPYAKAADFGTTEDFKSHFGVADEGTPVAMIIVPVEVNATKHQHD